MLCVVFVLMAFIRMIVWSIQWGVEGTTGEGEEWTGEPGECGVGEPKGRGIAAIWTSLRERMRNKFACTCSRNRERAR